MKRYEIDIHIDEITPCLWDSKAAAYVDTEYEKINSISVKTAKNMKNFEKWNFDWSDPDLADCDIYALYVKGSKVTQGLIACRESESRGNVEGYIEIALVESNPKNVGSNGRYKGVGAHLFSIASKLSMDLGYEGYVQFVSKTGLVEHYQKTLHADLLFDRVMVLSPEASQYLIDVYNEKARDKNESQ